MAQETIFIPFIGMMILTILVWFYMYYLRLTYLVRNKIDPQKLSSTEQYKAVLPEEINRPSENLINLFELPVLFYALCLYLYISVQVDAVYLTLAYGFLFSRIAHSFIHCTYNKVTQRFYAYLLSSIFLWLMIIVATLELIVG